MRRYAGLAIVCAGSLLAPLDTAVNVAFPAITAAFALALRDIQWMVVAYVVAQSILTIAFGRLGDVYGHRRIFGIGLAACALAHLAAGFAPDYGWLVALRVAQGVAVGLAVACAPALATLLFEPEDKRRVLAIYVTAFSLGLAIGPLAGGALIQWLGWPAVFWFRAPLALLVLLLLPLVPDARAPYALPIAQAAGATRAPPAAHDAAAPAGVWSALAAHLRAPRFAAVQLTSVAINLATFAILLLVPYALASWPGRSVAAAGALLALFPAGSLVGGMAAGRFATRASASAMIRAGLLFAALGLLLTALLLPMRSPAALAVALAFAGAGVGLFQVGYMDATTTMLPPHERGVAGGLVAATRLVGIVLGVTGIGALHEALASYEATIATMGAALLAFTAVAAVATRTRDAHPRRAAETRR